jgi:hypothetical protein
MKRHKVYLITIFENVYHTSTSSAQVLRQAQHRYFDKLSTGTSTGSAQVLRQAQHR